MENFKGKAILILPDDNVLVAIKTLSKGEKLQIGKDEIIINETILLGHKIARNGIKRGEKIIKYGLPIGSATIDIAAGSHVHIHNMKSDYIPTYRLDKETTYDK